MIKIGLTGNIASGKSEIEKIIKELGYTVYDFDKLTNDLYLEDEVKKKLKKEFNTDDKKTISAIAFKDIKKRRFLEELFHPLLYKLALEIFEKHNKERFVVLSGALIYEAGFDKLFDKIIFVDADFMLRLKRLKKRNAFDDKRAMTMLNCQTTKYKNKADFVILNNDSIEKLKVEIVNIVNKL